MTSFNSSKYQVDRVTEYSLWASQQTVGVICRVERDSFRVLDQNGHVRLVQPHQITMRKDNRRVISTDVNGHELRVGDNVKEADGEVRSPTLMGSDLTDSSAAEPPRGRASHSSSVLRVPSQSRHYTKLRHFRGAVSIPRTHCAERRYQGRC